MIFNQNLNNKNSQIFPLKTIRKIYNSEFTSIPRLAFTQCARLESVYFPNVTEIGSDAFWYCRNLTEFSGPEVAVINDFGLQDCRNLPSVSFPKCSYLGICGLQNAYKISEINIPSCEYIGNRAFQNCVTLSSIELPNISSVPSSAFQNCFSLSSITLSACSFIDVNAFSNCTSLLTMNLKNVTSIPVLANTSIFNYSPITGYFAQIAAYGSIYVPSSLYDAFISAEYWSNFSARITSATVPSEPLYYNSIVGELTKVWNYANYEFTQSAFINNVDYPSLDATSTALRGTTSLPLIINSSLATHLTFRVTTNSSFYFGFFGYTTVSFTGPHVYVSSALPADPTSVGTLLYKSPSDMSAAGGFTARVGIDSGNSGKFVTFVTSGFGSVNTWIRNRAEIESSAVHFIGTYINT